LEIKIRYYLAHDELVVEDIERNNVLWKGKPDGFSIHTVLGIPNSDDCIVLLKYWEKGGRFQNLLRVNSDGSVV